MPKLFLHGVPDTPRLWSPLLRALGPEAAGALTPAMPGFGCPLPAGFSCTKEAYADWLIGQLEAAGGGVDLVGHDWGALLAVRVASLRPDLIRTWAVTNALPDPAYRWHSTARMWQTPLLGEFSMAMVRPRALRVALIKGGMPADLAATEAQHVDKTMRQAILRLYRSAVHVGAEWGSDLRALPKRGLVWWGADDPFVDLATAERFCARWGVPLTVERGAGHWACAERPEAFAAALRTHWA